MTGSLLLRGMIVGLIAGVLAFGFARVFGEPLVDRAIAFEEQQAQAAAHANPAAAEPAEEETVSRPTQAGIGLLTGVTVFGAALGGIFALAFAFAHGRIGALSPRATAATLAILGFIAVVIVPDLKYPPNPPAVGNPDTIAQRTELFFAMLAISVAAMAGAVLMARRLAGSLGLWNAAIAAGIAYVVAIALVQSAMPVIYEAPETFSADLLWRFRVASIGMQAVLWAVIGLGFGMLAERALAPAAFRPAALGAR